MKVTNRFELDWLFFSFSLSFLFRHGEALNGPAPQIEKKQAWPLTPIRCGGPPRPDSTRRWRRVPLPLQLLQKTATSKATTTPLFLLLLLQPLLLNASRPRSKSTSDGSSQGCTRSNAEEEEQQ